MTEKKTTKNKTKATYKGKAYKILEQNENKTKLTDGVIHFWVKTKDVT